MVIVFYLPVSPSVETILSHITFPTVVWIFIALKIRQSPVILFFFICLNLSLIVFLLNPFKLVLFFWLILTSILQYQYQQPSNHLLTTELSTSLYIFLNYNCMLLQKQASGFKPPNNENSSGCSGYDCLHKICNMIMSVNWLDISVDKAMPGCCYNNILTYPCQLKE